LENLLYSLFFIRHSPIPWPIWAKMPQAGRIGVKLPAKD
jgi:hypothetical protein